MDEIKFDLVIETCVKAFRLLLGIGETNNNFPCETKLGIPRKGNHIC